jgi:hypothetical protein
MSAKYISEDSIMPVSTCHIPVLKERVGKMQNFKYVWGMMVQRKEMYLGWEDWHECRAH